MQKERGGIISNILFIPIGVALMAGFFFLGYYVGKYQSKTNQNEVVLPLPEIVSKNLSSKEDFTFFKTLTDKDKTISIDLKPKQNEEKTAQRPDAENRPDKNVSSKKEKKPEPKVEKRTTVAAKEPPQVRKEPVPARASGPKLRYALQVASYQEKKLADDDVRKMKQLGYAAFITQTDLQGKGTWYRVKLGSFSNKEAAEKLQQQLRKKESISSIVTVE